MSRKVFATDEILSASDVNEHLNPTTAEFIPYATETGVLTLVGDGSSFKTDTVQLTPGRFTQPPIVVVTSTNSLYFAYVYGITTTSFSAGLRHYSDTTWALTRSLNWVAIQMTD